MGSATWAFLLSLFGAVFLPLFVFTLLRKLRVAGKSLKAKKAMERARAGIEKILNSPETEFNAGLEEFALSVSPKDKACRTAIDAYLLEALGEADPIGKKKLIAIGTRMNFGTECIAQIRSGNPRISALGSRRAGLYEFREAREDMLAALDLLSSESQAEILAGLARMGDADLLQRAFTKISGAILINERAVIDILNLFPEGKKKRELFRNMIQSETPYLAALFLKAMHKDHVKALKEEIVRSLREGGKELRAAAVRALAKLGTNAPPAELILALEDRNWEVRALAARALGCINDRDVCLALFNALGDHQWQVRQNVANALLNQPGFETLFILAVETGDEYIKDSVISALENLGNPILMKSIKVMAT